MHPKTMFTKTHKGLQELEDRTILLPRDLGLVFLAVDGKRSVTELMQKAGMDASSLVRALDRLVANGYIKLSYEPPEVDQGWRASDDFDLDFTIPPRGIPVR